MKGYFKIDEFFRVCFMKFEVCPPEIIWDYIKQQLIKSKTENYKSEQNNGQQKMS